MSHTSSKSFRCCTGNYEPLNTIPEKALWTAVILQALIDASGGGVIESGDSRERTTREARLFLESNYCRWICSLADIELGYLKRKTDISKRISKIRSRYESK